MRRTHLVAAIVNTESDLTPRAASGYRAIDAAGRTLRLSPCITFGTPDDTRNAFRRAALPKAFADRAALQREDRVGRSVKMNDWRHIGDTVLRLRQWFPENTGERDGSGDPVPLFAQHIPRHGRTLRKAANDDLIAAETEPALQIIENLTNERLLVAFPAWRTAMRPSASKAVGSHEGQPMGMRGIDQCPMAHLRSCGRAITMEKDIGALGVASGRQFDAIVSAIDHAGPIAAAIVRGDGDRR